MDKNSVKTAIEGLKSSSSSRVQESLLKIRSKIIVHESGLQLFRECGGLEYVVPHLRKPNERILDLTLSILGNCLLDDQTCVAAGKLNIFIPLLTVLKTVSRDSIIGRACRVIGNLAQKTSNAEELHNNGAVLALTTLIENRDKNTSYPTLTMAVRAIRQLWMVIDKREEMLNINSVRCVAILLTNECESAGILKSTNPLKETSELRKSQEELINGILKCLGYFTTHANTQCAEQLQGDGRGYQCLVALTKTFETLALKCLMNLCYVSLCRPLLGIAGMVECLVGILQKCSNVLWWPEGAARALSQLSGESVNRSRLRHCGGLGLLVAAAKENMHAMRALLQYVFDDTSFQILINEGLISLLTEELTKHLVTMKIEHSYIDFSETEDPSDTPNDDSAQSTSERPSDEARNKSEVTPALYQRRKGPLSNTIEDELKVVIERDNMLVGFIDAIDSATDESVIEEEPARRKCLKRARSSSPNSVKKSSIIALLVDKTNDQRAGAYLGQRMSTAIQRGNVASLLGTLPAKCQAKVNDWSAGVYWEPKSPEWPSTSHSRNVRSLDNGPLSPYSDGNQSGFSPEYKSTNKRGRLDWSPESGISSGEGTASPYWTEYQWSPGSSVSPTSPFSTNEDSSDSEISGRYSPVCSENDTAEVTTANIVTVEMDAAQVAFDELVVDDGDMANDDDQPFEELKEEAFSIDKTSSRIAYVLVLMFRVSHGACDTYGLSNKEPLTNNMLELLTRRECLNALLDYVERCKKPMGRAARILNRLLSNALCLVNVLKHKLALRLHRMSVTSVHPVSKCQQCKEVKRLSAKLLTRLTILAESSYGIGEISYQLLRGSPSMKETLTLTLPYIVKAERTLKKFFIDCNALPLLFSVISEDAEDLNHYVTAVGKLATHIRIKDPKTLENKFTDHVIVTYDPILDNLSQQEIVIFELDDLSTVQANKVFLCQNSDVFSAMLMGCFKESIEECVRIKNVTKHGLEYLFTLLHLGLNDSTNDIKVFPMAEKLETNLEVLLLADRFLFEKLKELLSSAILQFQLTPRTADKIYVWSLNEGMGFLCIETVAYLLTGRMCETERTQSFKAILNLEFKEQWLDDVKTIIMRQLEQKM